MKRSTTLALLVFALNFGWEMAQMNRFASMQGVPFGRTILLCARAALGDLVIFAVAFATAALVTRDLAWPVRNRRWAGVFVCLATGLLITVVYERHAVRSGLWTYDARMALLFGIGLAPIAQWLVVPAIALAIYRVLWRTGPRSDRATI